jgi:3-oxoadipate enol-lactonase
VARTAILLATLLAIARVAGAQPASGTTPSGLFYETSGTGAPMVFVHAFSVDRRMWDAQVSTFEDGYRVIRYDLRGHGRSAAPESPYAGYEDLREVLDLLRIERATLVGLSAGSEVAINFALAYPARVERLVLASPGLGGYKVPPLPWATPVFEAARAGNPTVAAARWADTPIMTLRRDTSARERLRAMVADNARLWSYQRNERPLVPAAAGRLGEIRVPVLVLTGSADLPHILDIATAIASGVARSRHRSLEGAGHMLNLDDRAGFDEALRAFLKP